jgi:hypothetical protein
MSVQAIIDLSDQLYRTLSSHGLSKEAKFIEFLGENDVPVVDYDDEQLKYELSSVEEMRKVF